jgi:Fe2+ or Zn2+ uptake regulation protein
MKTFLYLGTRTYSPLTLKHRLVWSAVVNCNRTNKKRKGKAATPYLIKKRTGLHHATIRKALTALKSLELVDQHIFEGRRLIVAEEPKGEKATWFCWKKQRTKKWTDDLAWIVLYRGVLALPKAGVQPSEATEAVYWLLLSMAKKKPEKTHRTSVKRIGLRLGLTSKTVSRALRLLAEEEIIKFSTDANGTGFQLLKNLEPEVKSSEGVQDSKPEAAKAKSKRLTKEDEPGAKRQAEEDTLQRNKQFLRAVLGPEGWQDSAKPNLCTHGTGHLRSGRWQRTFRRSDLENVVEQHLRTRMQDAHEVDVWVNEEAWDCYRCRKENVNHFRILLDLTLHHGRAHYSFWMDKQDKAGIIWENSTAALSENKYAIECEPTDHRT